jgi:hypothetical protein
MAMSGGVMSLASNSNQSICLNAGRLFIAGNRHTAVSTIANPAVKATFHNSEFSI